MAFEMFALIDSLNFAWLQFSAVRESLTLLAVFIIENYAVKLPNIVSFKRILTNMPQQIPSLTSLVTKLLLLKIVNVLFEFIV